MTIDESVKVNPLRVGKELGEKNHGSECPGFCGDRNLGLIEVIPDLHGDETNQ